MACSTRRKGPAETHTGRCVRSAEIAGRQPPEARGVLVLCRPYGPAIAVPCKCLGGRAVAMLGPAHDAVEGVNAGWRLSPPEFCPARMAEQSQVQEQGNLPAGLAR